MSYPVSNVAVSSDTFAVWVDRTNLLCHLMSTQVVTANSLSTGSITTGNGFVNGIFSAQTFAVNVSLRGGNVNSSANLSIISNANFTGASINATSNIAFYTSNVYINAASMSLVGGQFDITSNVSAINSNVYINTASMSVVGGQINLTSNIASTQSNISLTTTSIVHIGTSLDTSANVTVTGQRINTSANVTVTGTVHAIAGNVAFDTSTLFVDAVNNRVGLGNTAPDATFTLTGTANVSGVTRLANTLTVIGAISGSNTLSITGNTTLSNTLAVTGATTLSNTLSIANTVTINTDHVVDVFSNTNLGSTTGSPVLVYSFPLSSYTTAKILAQVESVDNANTQGNEMILTHNGTQSTVTIYGTVAAPSGANLGVFSTSINSTAVALNFTQGAANTKVKIVAHLLK